MAADARVAEEFAQECARTLLGWLPFTGVAAAVVNGLARHQPPALKDS
jgi:hypothetical protein